MKKKYGQNFLINNDVINTIINVSKITNESEILEIGPGNGALTKEIINKNPKKFIAVEIDSDLKKNLENYFEKSNHQLIINDSIKFKEEENFTKKFSVISNLPYNISLALLIKWIYQINFRIHPKKMVLMFQKEVAERILANPNTKKYGRITLLVSAFYKVKKILDVDKTNFFPIPKVNSTILLFEELRKKQINFNQIKFLEKISFELFSNRRKQLKKKIQNLFSEATIEKNSLDIYFPLRAENLSKKIVYKLTSLLKKEKL